MISARSCVYSRRVATLVTTPAVMGLILLSSRPIPPGWRTLVRLFCISVWAIVLTRVLFTGAGVDVDTHLADARSRLAQNGTPGNRTPDPPDHYAALGLIRPDAPDHGQRVSAIEAGAYILSLFVNHRTGKWTDVVTGFVYRRCLLYTSPSPRDQRGSRMPSSA